MAVEHIKHQRAAYLVLKEARHVEYEKADTETKQLETDYADSGPATGLEGQAEGHVAVDR